MCGINSTDTRVEPSNCTEGVCCRCPTRYLPIVWIPSLEFFQLQHLGNKTSRNPERLPVFLHHRLPLKRDADEPGQSVSPTLLLSLSFSFYISFSKFFSGGRENKNNCRDYFNLQECFCFKLSVPMFQPEPSERLLLKGFSAK